MGRLTYVNRKITGKKLGQSIQRDIQKRIPKPGEERKLAAVQRDPVVELDASGRQLGEEGIFLVCDALCELGNTNLTRVEELNLSGNDLNVACLKELRRAIEACPDLRDLDLSNNKITITKPSDIKEWTHLLEGFANMRFLRRIDFSGNPLGDIAVEIICRTYALENEIFIPYDLRNLEAQEHVDEPADANYSVEGFDIRSSGGHIYLASHFPQVVETETTGVEVPRKMSNGTVATECSAIFSSSPNSSSLDATREAAEIHGLRGIPYMVFSDIGATDLSALWLSYIITEHPLPSEINPHLPPLKEGSLASTLRKYDSMGIGRGIIVTENSGITALGLRLLKEAEERRDEDAATVEELITNGQVRRRSSGVSDLSLDDAVRHGPNRKSFVQDDSFATKARKALNENRYNLDKTRAKIQLNVLREKGIEASLLWKRVMRLIAVSRTVLLDYTGPIEIDGHAPTLQVQSKSSARSSTDTNFSVATDLCGAMQSNSFCDELTKRVISSPPNRGPHDLPGRLPINLWMRIVLLAEDSDNLTTRTQRLNIFHWASSRLSIVIELQYLSESMECQTRRVLAKVKGLSYEL